MIEFAMFLEPVCKQEVLTEILRLDNLKLPGPDSLGPKIIKDIASIIIVKINLHMQFILSNWTCSRRT